MECRNDGNATTGSCRSTNWTQYTTTPSTSTTISGLVNGNAYSVRISATNSAGTSSTAEAQATPAARPRIPTGVDASTSGRSIQVTWTAPASGGSPITSYTVEFCSGGCTSWRSTTVSGNPPATTTTLTGLTTGTTYRVRVRAVNAAGNSGWSGTDTATTPTRPGTPTGVTFDTSSLDNDELTATWTAPAQVGSGISHYNVQRCTARANDRGVWSCSSGWSNAGTATTTSHAITGLTGSTAYLVRVQAANAAGTSVWSTADTAATTSPAAAPETPSGLTATASNHQIRLSWTAPNANGARITRYTIECQGSRTDGTHRCDDDKDDNNTYTTSSTSYTISSLTNGDSYTFTVSATNSAGTSSTTSVTETPATRPGRPTNIQITESYPGDGGVNLAITWTATAENATGGSPITGYTVQYRASNGNWSFEYFGPETSVNVNGLTVGPRYYVQIRSHNAVGESSWLQASSNPTGTPAKPAAPNLSSSTLGALEVSWDAFDSSNQGASAVTDYDVRWSTSRTVTIQGSDQDRCNNSWRNAPDTGDDATNTSTSYNITGLNGTTRYCVQVRAANIHGNGPWSDSTYETTQAAQAPDAPSGLTATASNRQIRLSWTAPNANGARITRYTIECQGSRTDGTHRCDDDKNDNNTYTTSSTSYTISSLTNGDSYTFTVSATNSAGTSSTTSVTETPATRPGRPDANNITFSEDYQNNLVNLTVNWIAPTDTGGSDITGYTLQYRVSGSNWSFAYFGENTTYQITSLTIGHRYDVQIRTHNAAGESSWTQVSRTPTGRPAKPTISSVSGGTNDLSVSWSEPSEGASSIISYNVQRCNASETTSGNNTTYRCTSGWTSAGTTTSTSFEISNLACGTRYGVRVQAVNSYGAGPWSDIDRTRADWSDTTSACPDN